MVRRSLSFLALLVLTGLSTEAKAQYVYQWGYPTPSAGKQFTVNVDVDVEGATSAPARSFRIEFIRDGVVVS